MKTVSFLILILLTTSCYSQNNLVEYYFSKEVNAEIDKYISKQLESDEDQKFYLTVYRETQFESAGNFQVVIGTINPERPNETVVKLVQASGRYYTYETKNIPVIFDYDFDFAKHGEDAKGRPVRIRVMQHSFLIEFEPRSGKVVESGYK